MNTLLTKFTRQSKNIAICTLCAVSLTHCASTQDGRTTQAQGAGIGAIGGALLGAGIGALTGGGSRAVARGAAIGAAAGGIGGFAYGTHVAKKKENYRTTELWLDACISEAEKKRSQAMAYNSRLNNEYARLKKEVDAARMAGDRRALANLKRQIASERAAAQREASAFSQEAQLQRSAIQQAGGQGGSKLQSLRTSTSGIESQVNSINRNVERFAALESQIDV